MNDNRQATIFKHTEHANGRLSTMTADIFISYLFLKTLDYSHEFIRLLDKELIAYLLHILLAATKAPKRKRVKAHVNSKRIFFPYLKATKSLSNEECH